MMKHLRAAAIAALFAVSLAPAALAQSTAATSTAAKQKTTRTFVVNNDEIGVPVFAYDITDRPYEVLGEVKAGVRKATVFSKEASQAKIYRELWERADKMGADAVVNAKYGDSHVSLMSWGKTNATGTAIKFKSAPVASTAKTGS